MPLLLGVDGCVRVVLRTVDDDGQRQRFDTKVKRRSALNGQFTPWTPVSTRAAFSGRYDEIIKVTGAVAQPGRHVILYGERGVGKTSLANIFSELLVQTADESALRNYAGAPSPLPVRSRALVGCGGRWRVAPQWFWWSGSARGASWSPAPLCGLRELQIM
jgi:hypothetical protein